MGKSLSGFCLSFLLIGACHQPSLEAISWSSPADLTQTGFDSTSPQIQIDDDQVCTAVWSRYDGKYFVVQGAQAKFKGAWSNPVTISDSTGNAFVNQMVLSPQDYPLVIWTKATKNGGTVIQTSQLAARGWTTPTTLSQPGPQGQNATNPSIAITETGYTVVVWQQNNGINNIIQSVTRKNNKDWSAIENVTIAVPGAIGDITPQVALDEKGNAFAVWIHTPTQSIQGSIRAQNGHWSLPTNIYIGNETLSDPEVAFDTLGNLIVLWTSFDGTNRSIRTVSRTTTGAWSLPQTLSPSGFDATNGQLAIDSGGNAVAVWQYSDGVNTIIQSSFRNSTRSGAIWSTPINLSIAGEDASDPEIFINSQRTVGVTWKRSDGSNFIIQSSTKNVGANWTTPASISTHGEDAMSPQIALDKHNNEVVVWQRSDGQCSVIQAAFGFPK